MDNLSHWSYAEVFTAHEAAYLIVGQDPNGPDEGAHRFPKHVHQRIIDAFQNAITIAKFNAGVGPCIEDDEDLPLESACLFSVELEEEYKKFLDGDEVGFQAFLGYDRSTTEPSFSRENLRRWIAENNLYSAYEFGLQNKTDGNKEEKPLGYRERTTLLNIVGALLELHNQKDAATIGEILERYPAVPGLKQRTLEDKFAAARRSLKSA